MGKPKKLKKPKRPNWRQMGVRPLTDYLRAHKVMERWTTLNGACQLALAVHDDFDQAAFDRLLMALGQRSEARLSCVYCEMPADSWDHLHSTVQDTWYSGYGNRIFNLVPSCTQCNTSKGQKHWKAFLNEDHAHAADLATRVARLEAVEAMNQSEKYPWSRIQTTYPELSAQYRRQISELREKLTVLDSLASQIRENIRNELDATRASQGPLAAAVTGGAGSGPDQSEAD